MAKVALLIGVSEYKPGLNPLPAAVKDIEAMRRVLVHPEMGGFAEADITVLKNPQRQEMEEAIYRLFANRQKDDLLLFYFSGHGIKDESGRLYLSTRATYKEKGRLFEPSAVAASTLHERINKSKSQRQVLILDCCFSGAIAQGLTVKDDGSVNVQEHLGGKGRAILTASTSTQYSFEQEGSELSVYTRYLVEGIEKGAADKDGDGWISVDELHNYASVKVTEAAPAMTPKFYPVEEGYRIRLAKSPKDDPRLKYRKELDKIALEDEGDISPINRFCLEELRNNLKLSTPEAEEIELEVLEPYRKRREKLQRYEQALSQAIKLQYPLRQKDRNALKRFQTILNLRDEDIAQIEARVIAPKKAEYERNLKQAEQRQQEAEQLKRQLTPTPSPAPNSHTKIKTQLFEFEVATLSVVKKSGWFSGEKVTCEINRSRGRAEFFTEDLGNGVTLEMVTILGGKFLMGSPESEQGRAKSEEPQHTVTIQPFFMGKFPVTQAQWQVVASLPKVNIDLKPDPSNFKGANRPVEQVSWYEAFEFCARLSKATGREYRLPSEAEWEYACRAGTTTPFHFGETISTGLANYCGENRTINGTLHLGSYGNGSKGIYRQQTTDVGSFPANAFGLYDMHGNVWEWCEDTWHENYNGAPTDGSAWINRNDNGSRLLRGGSWDFLPRSCRSTSRVSSFPDLVFINIGFRVVCKLPRTL
ncbi:MULTISPECIES: caspase, EACC1-associated type [unclassified Coleofasciculus]|uniref:caspase, EACC1-associated type n=1 Tax=unclassified Coleofasciculus TaxID=2692782 RepID=UPI00187EED50|nr:MULTISPECIES: SUMF1/EgtB/PvdO family nonheme iron enzyme [unclassified Coleofasciculus]MBE9126919.1 SUMF1/EgtB/PvdO family nonheme iron enzyme [Coleofasciculus sp. LEGE 07081]MBE9148670.1 SUMF1/EgtB/PvdO family nonheme iron enzyme [Coleofasciculus sp. LEGE 07092]